MRHITKYAAVGLALLSGASDLQAQGPGLFEMFGSRRETDDHPLSGGLSLAGFHGPFGLRASGSLNLRHVDDSQDGQQQSAVQCYGGRRGGCRRVSTQYGSDHFLPYSVGAWTGDVDLVLAPLRAVPVLRALALGFSPYGFVGIGGYGVKSESGPDSTNATLSYGAGAYHSLLGRLGVSGEARFRRSLGSDSAIAYQPKQAWEYRVGFTIDMHRRRSSGASPVSRPPVVVPSPVPTAVIDAPVARTVEPAAPSDEALARRAAGVLDAAEGYLGTPFARGGSSQSGGVDAAGFVQLVMASEGVRLPRLAREQAAAGEAVSNRIGALRAGDLLFFANDGTTIDHVAIYVGRDRFIHASASGGGVRYDVLGEGERGRWFADHLVTARRVLTQGAALQAPVPDVRYDAPDRAPKPDEGT